MCINSLTFQNKKFTNTHRINKYIYTTIMQFSFREPSTHFHPTNEYRYSAGSPSNNEEDGAESFSQKGDQKEKHLNNIKFGNRQPMMKNGDDDPWSDYSPEHDNQSIFVEINSPNFSPTQANPEAEKIDRENFTFSKKANAERNHIKIDLTLKSPRERNTATLGSFDGSSANDNPDVMSFAGKRSEVFTSRNEEYFQKENWKISELLMSPKLFDDMRSEEVIRKSDREKTQSVGSVGEKDEKATIFFHGVEMEDEEEELEQMEYEEPESGAIQISEGIDGRKSSEKRDFNEFLRNQRAYERKKEEKRKQLMEIRESKLQNLFSHQPTINQVTINFSSLDIIFLLNHVALKF